MFEVRAWPIAVGSQKNLLTKSEVTFRCSKRGSEEAGRLRAPLRTFVPSNVDAA